MPLWTIVRDSAHILLECTPGDVHFDDAIRDIEGLRERAASAMVICGISARTLTSSTPIWIYTTETDLLRIELIKRETKLRLEKYNIKQATLGYEC
jgi:Co/Zn/Cd efflux system component